ncbi:uncharacterized protein LOC110430149 isoform X2 [Sorghum bicolor]|uniref:uncharacterized protein LOC110430149 isoform X2 n=1 Tax=Sorghum bicolor TaxID=4558 RepID=UPI000B423ECC|nr:uncharacterized protein LOC110430149 isoform X2 [Sorghum bicolor]|eukprot:XP_021302894.1 uncharacterized protein LOC110430149 isoform X2 [Sorghum bicolor]
MQCGRTSLSLYIYRWFLKEVFRTDACTMSPPAAPGILPCPPDGHDHVGQTPDGGNTETNHPSAIDQGVVEETSGGRTETNTAISADDQVVQETSGGVTEEADNATGGNGNTQVTDILGLIHRLIRGRAAPNGGAVSCKVKEIVLSCTIVVDPEVDASEGNYDFELTIGKSYPDHLSLKNLSDPLKIFTTSVFEDVKTKVVRKWENKGTLENILEELKIELQRQKEIKLN